MKNNKICNSGKKLTLYLSGIVVFMLPHVHANARNVAFYASLISCDKTRSTQNFSACCRYNCQKGIGVMGTFRRGPKEFISPVLFQSIGHRVFVLDHNQHKQAYCSIDSLAAVKEPFISLSLDSIKISSPYRYIISFPPHGEHLFQ